MWLLGFLLETHADWHGALPPDLGRESDWPIVCYHSADRCDYHELQSELPAASRDISITWPRRATRCCSLVDTPAFMLALLIDGWLVSKTLGWGWFHVNAVLTSPKAFNWSNQLTFSTVTIQHKYIFGAIDQLKGLPGSSKLSDLNDS